MNHSGPWPDTRHLSSIGWLRQSWFGPAMLAGLFTLLLGGLLVLIDRATLQQHETELSATLETTSLALESRIRSNEQFLESMAASAIEGGDTLAMRSQARRFLDDHPEVNAVARVGRGGQIAWAEPTDANQGLAGQPADFVAPAEDQVEAERELRSFHSRVYQTLNGEEGFATIVPVITHGRFDGTLVCVYSAERLLRQAIQRTTLEYHHPSLIAADGLVAASLPVARDTNPRLVRSEDLTPPGNGLSLQLAQYDRTFWTWGTLALVAMCTSLVGGMAWGMWSLKRQINDRVEAERALRQAHDELERRVLERTADLATANERLKVEMQERERAERQLREHHDQLAHASRVGTMGEMAAGLAHELNQPLGAITTYADGSLRLLGQHNATDEPRIREALHEIADHARHAGQIIHRLREFVAPNSPRRVATSVEQLVDEVVDLLDSELRHSQVQLSVRLPRRLPMVMVDRIQVQQVLVNLLRNAVEAMADVAERRVTISAGIAGEGRVVVSVADTGAGCDPEVLKQMFEPFFTTRRTGMGMGLSISRSIIEAHDGQLGATVNPEGGLTFRFTLPIAEGVRYARGFSAAGERGDHDLRGG